MARTIGEKTCCGFVSPVAGVWWESKDLFVGIGEQVTQNAAFPPKLIDGDVLILTRSHGNLTNKPKTLVRELC